MGTGSEDDVWTTTSPPGINSVTGVVILSNRPARFVAAPPNDRAVLKSRLGFAMPGNPVTADESIEVLFAVAVLALSLRFPLP